MQQNISTAGGNPGTTTVDNANKASISLSEFDNTNGNVILPSLVDYLHQPLSSLTENTSIL